MTVEEAITAAERILPGIAADAGAIDPRWQAILAIGNFIEDHPNEVWNFAAKWGCVSDDDLRAAVATCLVEHLLEHHFDRVFPMVEKLAIKDPRFAETFLSCWDYGQSEQPANAARLRRLRTYLRRR